MVRKRIDRNAGVTVDLFQNTAEQMYFPYVRPQENGYRTDTRWLTLKEKNGKGLTINCGIRMNKGHQFAIDAFLNPFSRHGVADRDNVITAASELSGH